jgi:hypothetical protein
MLFFPFVAFSLYVFHICWTKRHGQVVVSNSASYQERSRVKNWPGGRLPWNCASFHYTGSSWRYHFSTDPSHYIIYNNFWGFMPYRIMLCNGRRYSFTVDVVKLARPIPSITMARANPCYTKLRTTMVMFNVNDSEPNLLPSLLNLCPFCSSSYNTLPTVPSREQNCDCGAMWPLCNYHPSISLACYCLRHRVQTMGRISFH